MQKRIHKKSWQPKVNQHYLNNIFAHLDEKQYDLRRSKPMEWWQHMLEKAKAFNEKYIKKGDKVNA